MVLSRLSSYCTLGVETMSLPGFEVRVDRLQQQQYICNRMPIHQFLNLDEEQVVDPEDDIAEAIA
jgi:hypothetical protein